MRCNEGGSVRENRIWKKDYDWTVARYWKVLNHAAVNIVVVHSGHMVAVTCFAHGVRILSLDHNGSLRVGTMSPKIRFQKLLD